jgi:hypothetical protein
LTLASFVPKKSKAVIVVSTMHHSKEIDLISEKPRMILDYNKKKGIQC